MKTTRIVNAEQSLGKGTEKLIFLFFRNPTHRKRNEEKDRKKRDQNKTCAIVDLFVQISYHKL